MIVKRQVFKTGASLIALACTPAAALAQDAPNASLSAPDPAGPEAEEAAADIVVSGIRRSIAQSLDQKRNAISVVDVITAEDIGKLPDNNIAESMSRIPGVQISRRDGEGNTFAIRGLDLNRVEINGRSFTGPNQSATPALQSLNPEILASVEVIKSPTADRIEGALGGTVNLKTRRPLDSDKNLAAGRIQGSFGDLVDKLSYRASGLVSHQFADGRFGILGAVVYGETKGIAQGFSTGGWRTVTGQPGVYQPNRVVSQIEARHDRKLTANGAIQWKPDDDTDIVLEGTYSNFKVDRRLSYYQTLLTPTPALGQTASLVNPTILADGTLAKATFNNVTLRPLAYFALTDFESLNLGTTLKRQFGNLTLVAEGSYSKGTGTDGQTGAPFTFVMANSRNNITNVTYDLTTSRTHPDYALSSNYDVNNPQAFQLFSLFDGQNLSDNKGYDGKIDLQYEFDDGVLKSLKTGFRAERIQLYAVNPQSTPAVNAAMLAAADKNGDGVIRPDELPALNYNNQYSGNFLPGIAGNFSRDFLTGVVDPVTGRQNIGVGNPAANPSSVKDVTQDTYAGYGMADLAAEIGSIRIRGNLGARYVVTHRTSAGFAVLTGVATPVSSKSKFNYFLPSGNLAVDLTDNLVLRVSAAKVIARPPLDLVGPGRVINQVNFSATAGNPLLRPFEAFQKDVTLEWYFGQASLLSVALFDKDINSFTTQTVTPITIDVFGVPTAGTLSQPQNGQDGKVRGFELNYQHALRFLPAPFDGLGIQANYTYATSDTPVADELNPGKTLPLANLSKNSYNLVGYYEDDRLSMRVAYSYRSKYLQTVQSASLGGSIYRDSYGQLDLSGTYNISQMMRVTFDATALNRPLTREFTGTQNRTSLTYINDRRFSLGIAANF